MSNALIAALFAIGSATWVGNKFYKRTGSNAQKAIGGGIVAGILAFLIMLTILSTI